MRSLLGPRTVGVMLFLSGQAAMAQSHPYPECTAEPTEGDIAAAKGAFQAGQVSFNEADYDRTITYWEDAYRRDCTAHEQLLNLARAYELKGDKAQAVEALQTFLARKPESSERDQIERRIHVLNEQIAKESQIAAPPPDATKSAETKPAEPAQKAQPTQEAAPAKPESSSNHWIGPVIVGGVGVAAVVSGVVLHSIGSSDEQEAEDACPTRRDCSPNVEEQGNSGITKQKVGVGLMIGGGAAIAGGVAWYFLTKAAPSAAAPKDTAAAVDPKSRWVVVPEAGPDYAGLTALGTF